MKRKYGVDDTEYPHETWEQHQIRTSLEALDYIEKHEYLTSVEVEAMVAKHKHEFFKKHQNAS